MTALDTVSDFVAYLKKKERGHDACCRYGRGADTDLNGSS